MKNGPLAAFLAALLLCAEATAESRVRIDETNFPDAAFRAYVETLDQDGDGFLTQTERNAVTYIDVSGSAIEDLTGLAYFPALEVLDCSHNALTALDMAKHPKLSALYCYHNALTSLNVSGNPALTLLDCDDNSLISLDVTHNAALTDLYCQNNQLTSLDTTANPALIYLDCDGNALTGLDVTRNPALSVLECSRNELTALDATGHFGVLRQRAHGSGHGAKPAADRFGVLG